MKDKEVPNKYKKHQALVLLGLKTQDELDRDLTRFNSANLSLIKGTILEKIQSSDVPTAYLLSLIPKEDFHKLPNCIVSSEADFEKLEELLKKNPSVVEIWAFPKEIGASIGRFAINNMTTHIDLGTGQILEEVWSTNHRDIEKYDAKSSVPIISASRSRWKQKYRIDKAENIPPEEIDKYVRHFVDSALEIERRRDRIEDITEYFSSLGIHSFSLEYRRDSRGFSFIDWDADRDNLVLEDLFPQTKKEQKGIENDAR